MDKFVLTDDNVYIKGETDNIENLMIEWLTTHNFKFNRYICCYILGQLKKRIKFNTEDLVLLKSVINVFMISILPSVYNYFDNIYSNVENKFEIPDLPDSLFKDYLIVLDIIDKIPA